MTHGSSACARSWFIGLQGSAGAGPRGSTARRGDCCDARLRCLMQGSCSSRWKREYSFTGCGINSSGSLLDRCMHGAPISRWEICAFIIADTNDQLNPYSVRAIMTPFTNMKVRIENCRGRVRELRQELNSEILIDIRKEGKCSFSSSAQLPHVYSIWYSPGRQERNCFGKTGSPVIAAALRPGCNLES